MSQHTALSASEQKKEDWMNTKWRPMMGWVYMVVCMADFVLFPVLWSMVQAIHGGNVTTQWQPITLQGAGLFHMAMGAIIGVAVFGRTQEKLAGANNGGAAAATTGFSSGAAAPSIPASVPFSPAPTSFRVPAPSPFSAAPAFSGTGKPMPVQPDQPEL
jgi:hypothetical protein